MDLLLFLSLIDVMEESQTIAYQQPGITCRNDFNKKTGEKKEKRWWSIKRYSQKSARAWRRESTFWFCALKSLMASNLQVRLPKSSLWNSPCAYLICRNMQNPFVTVIARTPSRPNINAIFDDYLFSSWLIFSWCSSLGFLCLSRCGSSLGGDRLGLWWSPESL